MRPRHWILDGKKVVPADLMTWAHWLEDENTKRTVASTDICGLRASTVFIGLDHNFLDDGPPILWETMVFGAGEWDMDRCAGSWEQAEEMHNKMCERVRLALGVEAEVPKEEPT